MLVYMSMVLLLFSIKFAKDASSLFCSTACKKAPKMSEYSISSTNMPTAALIKSCKFLLVLRNRNMLKTLRKDECYTCCEGKNIVVDRSRLHDVVEMLLNENGALKCAARFARCAVLIPLLPTLLLLHADKHLGKEETLKLLPIDFVLADT